MSVRRSVVWGFIGQFTTAATSFIGSAIVARLISPREVGVYAAGMAAMALITVINSFGANAYVVRQDRLTEDQLVAAFTVNTILNIALSSAALVLSTGAAHWLGDVGVAHVLRLLALVPIIQVLEFRPSAMLAREMRFQQIAIVNIAAALLSTTTIVTAAYLGQSYMSLAYGVLAGAVLNAAGVSLYGQRHVSLALSLRGARPIMVFGVRMMSIGGVAVAAQRLSEIMLGRILGLAALGLYSRASNLSNVIFSNLYGTATRISFSKLSLDFRETGRIKETFVSAFEMITGVMWPIVIGLAVLSRPFIYHVYGARWLESAPILSILMVSLFVGLCFGMNWELFVLNDETARQTRFELLRAVFGTIFFVGGARLGLIGAGLGRLGEALLGLALYLPHMRRLAGLGRREMLTIYGRGAIITAMAVAPSLLLMLATNWNEAVPLWVVATAVAIGIAAWLAGLKLLKHPLFSEIAVMTRNVSTRWRHAR